MIQLDNDYQRDNFLKFLEEDFLTDFKKDLRPVNISGLSSIKQANYLGESKELDLQVFEFLFEGSPNKRVALTTDAFSVMRSSAIFQALAVFHSPDNKDWRFSLMTATPEPTEKGKVSVTYSNPKRLSFFLGPNAKINTPTKFLINSGKVLDFEDLKNRFSIEVVNKEFYKQIQEQYYSLVGGKLGLNKKAVTYKSLLRLPSQSDHNQECLEFAVRLIGRIIFCWFLREKKSQAGLSLMPKELLSLEAVNKYENYYHKILEPIFFEVLNKPAKSRIDDFIKEPFSSVPYLNGGLFSPQEDDYYKRSNSDLQSQFNNTLEIPDSWFRKFFKVLETYNFTIDENTSYDEELSIDPEMLGRIFENLLAEINPETGESARKSTGSFYTPRIIVNYMVDESLLLYLKKQTGINEKKLRAIISYDLNDDSENKLTVDDEKKIIDSLGKIKIVDPACGSGAFPIGALQKILFILQQTDRNGQLWFKEQIKNTSLEIRRVFEREFAHKNFDYLRKLGIIRENIYGVDIQPIATEISRLRCFLTIIVDQRIQDGSENRGIEPLPNLDFKFVTANSLISLPKFDEASSKLQQEFILDDRENIDKLKNIRDQYFASEGIEREQLKLAFSEQQKVLIKQMYKEHGFAGMNKSKLTQNLTDWEPFTHKTTGWFDPEWMFGIKDGFDIVIANPPYDVYEGHRDDEIKIIRSDHVYDIASGGKLNAYKLFLAKSVTLQKTDGILCEIFQNSFLGDNSAKLLRKYFLNNQQIIQIDSFPERDNVQARVFEGVKMSVCILLSLKKKEGNYEFTLNTFPDKHMISPKTSILRVNDLIKISSNCPIPTVSEKELMIVLKLSKLRKIEDIAHCYQGEINLTVHSKLLHKENAGYEEVIKGAAIQKWFISDKMSQGEFVYLDEKKYLDENRGLKSRHHLVERIVMQGITGVNEKIRLKATLIDKGNYCAHSVNYLIKEKENISYFGLLGLLNSNLLNWYFKLFNTNSNVNSYEIAELPIPKTDNLKGISETVVNIFKLFESQKSNISCIVTDINKLEQKLDEITYTLYELEKSEIDIIENSSKK